MGGSFPWLVVVVGMVGLMVSPVGAQKAFGETNTVCLLGVCATAVADVSGQDLTGPDAQTFACAYFGNTALPLPGAVSGAQSGTMFIVDCNTSCQFPPGGGCGNEGNAVLPGSKCGGEITQYTQTTVPGATVNAFAAEENLCKDLRDLESFLELVPRPDLPLPPIYVPGPGEVKDKVDNLISDPPKVQGDP